MRMFLTRKVTSLAFLLVRRMIVNDVDVVVDMLALLEGEPEPPPEPEPESCVASYLLGADDSRLNILSRFRDEKMAKSTAGAYLIRMYYDTSGELISLCEKNPVVKRSLKLIIESLIPVLH